MDISLDVFRANASGDNGFIRESRRHEGTISQYGNRVFETHRNFASEEENINIREKFFNALVRYGVADDTLSTIRRRLGLDDRAQASQPLERRLVRQILHSADVFVSSRAGFAARLAKEGYTDSDIKNFIFTRLELSRPEQAQRPFSDDEQRQFRLALKKESLRLFDLKREELNFPEPNKLLELLQDKDECRGIMGELEKLSLNGKCNGAELENLKNDINRRIVAKRRETWENVVGQMLQEQEQNSPGCSGLRDRLLEKLDTIGEDILGREEGVIQDLGRLDDIFRGKLESLCRKMVEEAQPMLARLESVNPPFGEAQKIAMRSIAYALGKYRSPKLMDILSQYRGMALPFMEVALKSKPTMEDFMEGYGTYQRLANKLSLELAAEMKEYGGGDCADILEQLFKLGKAAFQDKHGRSFQATDGLKDVMRRYCGEMQYLQDHASEGESPRSQIIYSEQQALDASEHQILNIKGCAALLGVENLEISQEGVENLSQPVMDFLTDYSMPMRNSHNRPLDRILGEFFQRSFVNRLNEMAGAEDKSQQQAVAIVDLQRVGTSWKLGGDYVAKNFDYNGKDISDRITRFFEQDPQNGERAAKILGNLLNQQFSGLIDNIRRETGVLFSDVLLMQNQNANDFEVNRNEDGSYDIQCKILTQWANTSTMSNDGRTAGSDIQALDRTKSRLEYHFHLTLAFDEGGKPSFTLAEEPTFAGGLYDSPLAFAECTLLENLVDTQSGENIGKNALFDSRLLNDSQLKTLLQSADQPALVSYLRGKTITSMDEQYLMGMGMPETLVRNLLHKAIPAEKSLDKELLDRLFDANANVRAMAVAEVKELCQPYFDKGWVDDFQFNPEIALLVKYGGVAVDTTPFSDFMLLRNAVLTSDDTEIQNLPLALASPEADKAAEAKALLAELLVKERRAAGVDCLRGLPVQLRFSEAEVSLLKNAMDQRSILAHLEHIYVRDEMAESSAKALKSFSNVLDFEQKVEAYHLPSEQQMEELAKELTTMEIPDRAAKIRQAKMDFQEMRRSGKFSTLRLEEIRNEINQAIAEMRKNHWGNVVWKMVSEWLEEELPGADSAELGAFLFQKVQKAISDRISQLDKVMDDASALDDVVVELCRGMLEKRSLVLKEIEENIEGLSDGLRKATKMLVAKFPKLDDPLKFHVFAKFREAMLPVLELSTRARIEFNDFFNAYTQLNRNLAEANVFMNNFYHERNSHFGGEDSMTMLDQLYEMAVACFKDKHGEEPHVTDALFDVIVQFKREMEYYLEITDASTAGVRFDDQETVQAFAFYQSGTALENLVRSLGVYERFVDILNQEGDSVKPSQIVQDFVNEGAKHVYDGH